jgi:asparaginyl-tRNA synthetase
MDTVTIGAFRHHVDEEVAVRGWLHNKRSSGKLRFLIVRDGSGYAQAVVSKKTVPPESWEAIDGAGQESTSGCAPPASTPSPGCATR